MGRTIPSFEAIVRKNLAVPRLLTTDMILLFLSKMNVKYTLEYILVIVVMLVISILTMECLQTFL